MAKIRTFHEFSFFYQCFFANGIIQLHVFILLILQFQMIGTQNILNESCQNQAIGHLKIKLSYMQRQKERIQVLAAELSEKMQILRSVHQELLKKDEINIEQFYTLTLQQNKVLQQQYSRILNQNSQLSSSLLLSEQIIDQNQIESMSIIKNYEEKIIELRRLNQSKETFIQNLQAKLKINEEIIITPANNVTILFFNEIQQLKKAITTLTYKNKLLEGNNSALNIHNEKLSKRLNLLQSLTSNSKIMFDQFKLHYHQKKNIRHSAPKKDIYVPLEARLNEQLQKRSKEQQSRSTREFSEYIPNQDSQNEGTMKNIIYKSCLENQNLKSQLKKTKDSLSFIEKSKKSILHSYEKQQQSLQKNIEELNYYKNSTLTLMRMISWRRDQIKSRSLQKSKSFRVVEQIKQPLQMNYITQRKSFWLNVQSNIKIDKIKLMKIKKRYVNRLRSFSCIVDYKRMENDKIDTLLNKKMSSKTKATEANDSEKLVDFSQMIKDPFGLDFSVIQTSSKKVTYSQWKKNNGKNNFNNLTIINQNIL